MKEREKKTPSLQYALICMAIIIAYVSVGMLVLKVELRTLMLSCWIIVSVMAYFIGFKFEDLEKVAYDTIRKGLQANLILLSVGALVASWITAGTVPTLIYYGLKVISPQFFLLTTLLLSSIVSVATGTSWGTVGTVGLAMIGVGAGLGIPQGMTAGAVICGAFFGDKMSPVSDSTNLAAAVSGTDVMSHVKCMCYTTAPAYIISAFLFLIIGLRYGNTTMDYTLVEEMLNVLSSNMKISIITLLPAILFIILLVKGTAPVLSVLWAALSGFIVSLVYQKMPFTESAQALYSGVALDYGNEFVNKLLQRGGIASMYSLVGICIIALGLGGMLDASGILQTIVNAVAKKIKSVPTLIGCTMLSSYFGNMITASNNFAMILTATLFGPLFDDHRVKRQNLSRILEDAGTLSGPLIPWNINAVYCISMLAVPWSEYAPYCFLNYITPIISLIFGIIGFSIFKYTEEEWKAKKAAE